jgi:hypothetical protein
MMCPALLPPPAEARGTDCEQHNDDDDRQNNGGYRAAAERLTRPLVDGLRTLQAMSGRIAHIAQAVLDNRSYDDDDRRDNGIYIAAGDAVRGRI